MPPLSISWYRLACQDFDFGPSARLLAAGTVFVDFRFVGGSIGNEYICSLLPTVQKVEAKYQATIVALQGKYDEMLEDQIKRHEEAMAVQEKMVKEIMEKYEQVVKDSEGVYASKGKGGAKMKDESGDEEDRKKKDKKKRRSIVDSEAFSFSVKIKENMKSSQIGNLI